MDTIINTKLAVFSNNTSYGKWEALALMLIGNSDQMTEVHTFENGSH